MLAKTFTSTQRFAGLVAPIGNVHLVGVSQVFLMLMEHPRHCQSLAVIRPWADGGAIDCGAVFEDIRGHVRQGLRHVIGADATGPLKNDLHMNEWLVESDRLHYRTAIGDAWGIVQAAIASGTCSATPEMMPAEVAVAPFAMAAPRVPYRYAAHELPGADS